jgi:nickel transport protein
MAIPFIAFGHGTDYRLIDDNAVVAAEFFYSDKAPMQYAEVLIFGPENRKIEFQNGRTDQNGRFAFLAETPGEWQIKVNDGMGHAVNATVTVKPGNSEKKPDDEISGSQRNKVSKKSPRLFGAAPAGIRAIFGLSILLNLSLAVYVWKLKT